MTLIYSHCLSSLSGPFVSFLLYCRTCCDRNSCPMQVAMGRISYSCVCRVVAQPRMRIKPVLLLILSSLPLVFLPLSFPFFGAVFSFSNFFFLFVFNNQCENNENDSAKSGCKNDESGNLQFLGVFENAFPEDMCITFRKIEYHVVVLPRKRGGVATANVLESTLRKEPNLMLVAE